MDIKDEILLRLQNTLNSKDSYITYLQKLLREHDVDYQDFQLFDNPVDLELLKHNSDVASSKSSKFPPSSNSQSQNLACNQNKNICSEASSVSPSANSKEQIRVQPQSFSERQLHSHQRIYLPQITSEHINRFISYFHGREDVYANRAGKKNPKTGKYGYYPKCANFFKQGICLKTLKGDNNSNFKIPSQANLHAADLSSAQAPSSITFDDNYDTNSSYSFSERPQDLKHLNMALKDKSQKFSCAQCQFRKYVPLSPKAVYEHFLGMKINCSDVIGIYPILPDETCHFLVFDFDDHGNQEQQDHQDINNTQSKYKEESSDTSAKSNQSQNSMTVKFKVNDSVIEDVQALKQILNLFSIPYLVERSRSGTGYHVWLFFEEAVKVQVARHFGNALLTAGAEMVNLKSFKTYDRMIPASDHLPKGGLGNLIALPLQGMALREGNSAFVDDNFIPYSDQFSVLFNTRKIPKLEIQSFLRDFMISERNQYGLFYEMPGEDNNPALPSSLLSVVSTDLKYKSKNDMSDASNASVNDHSFTVGLSISDEQMIKHGIQLDLFTQNCADTVFKGTSVLKKEIVLNPEDVIDKLTVVLSHKLFIKESSLKPRFLNQLRRLSSFINPQFFINERMGYSNYATPRIISCFTEEKGYIGIPRGLFDELTKRFNYSHIEYALDDRRNKGSRIKVSFNGQLFSEQKTAADTLLKYNQGILQAATAFGKTVVGAYIISKLKVNTLVIVHNEEIANNWFNDFNRFLSVDEPLPEYKTTSGRIRHRKSAYGFLSSKRNTLTSIIDVVMVQSLGSLGNIKSLVKNYGLVIVDECHHSAAESYFEALSQINSFYFYGFSATPFRNDGLERKLFYLFGPVRFRYTALDKVASLGIPHYVISRFISFSYYASSDNLNQITDTLLSDERRNEIIISDVKDAILNHRTPVVITKRLEHARLLFDRFRGAAQNIILLTGALSAEEKRSANNRLKNVPQEESLILIATGQYIGEGFNYPRLDTLFMTAPISSKNNVEQYAGRLNRDYSGKEDIIIFDYVDNQIPMLSNMYKKRVRTYHKIGFNLVGGLLNYKNTNDKVKTFFYTHDYLHQLSLDLKNAQREIIISSNCSDPASYRRLTDSIYELQLIGVKTVVITSNIYSSFNAGIDFNTDTENRAVLPAMLNSSTEDMLENFCYNSGIAFIKKDYKVDSFIVIDRKLIWYGSDFIEGVKRSDVVIRLESADAAAELLEQ
ncbi:TOTE conflict system archaeo-eukaryotic primase domain-containing protein [Succinivibrio dextrinosolvens]|uniref:Superfamily II DNA or RNA helicase n=1 Tax=Succinivibrio dextrinosolvens TaxID=83771 RepID=A0A662ZAE3_9GAMM|nr:DEAD/DEAH box helicase family protein [Succinivibrio dextrinosolvens]SFK21223.1 Superfamily II DNA or RNA helicase [Succinivibrio dextrinosolvens]